MAVYLMNFLIYKVHLNFLFFLIYIHEDDFAKDGAKISVIREDFVDYLDIHEDYYGENYEGHEEPIVTGVVLGKTVLKLMHNLALNPIHCVGVGCDGCSVNISSEKVGAITQIQTEAKHSCLCVCKNNALNLSISKCSTVQSVRNALATIQEIAYFFEVGST